VERPARKLTPREAAQGIAPPPPALPPERPRIENTRTIEIERFVPRSQIDASYHQTPYYIAPRDLVGQEAFAVIRDAMAGKDLVGLARIVLSSRERPIILEPMGAGLRGITLRYAHEIRSEGEYFAEIPDLRLPPEMIRIAEHILETKTGDFDPAYLEDRYRTSLVSLLREKKAQTPARTAVSSPSPKNVINLMDILKRSLSAERESATSKHKEKRAAAAATPRDAAKRSKRVRKSDER
jgi:Ku protein